jgi:dienelactone hydrolase
MLVRELTTSHAERPTSWRNWDTWPSLLQRCRHELSPDPDRGVRIMTAGLEVLLGDKRADPSKVVVIGYCYGGTLALEFGRSGADLKAIVCFYAGLVTPRPSASSNIRGSVLVCTGSEDPYVPLAMRQAFEEEMTAAGVDWQVNVYGGAKHNFSNPDSERIAAERGAKGLGYDAKTDKRSWRAMLDLFDEVTK